MFADLIRWSLGSFVAAGVTTVAWAADPDPSDWDAVLAEAKGQTVFFNAWGGSQNINDYINWAGSQLSERYGITVKHVKLDDTASAVATVVAEKTAGKDEGGRVDLIWINGSPGHGCHTCCYK